MDLSPLLAPRSVAVVGATSRESAYGSTVVTNLLRAGYTGRLVGIHPKRRAVHGVACVPRLSDLDEPVDAVVVATPAESVTEVVEEAGVIGCGGAVVFAAEFAETGHSDRQQQLVDAAARHRIPVIGPNANGIVAVHARAPLWGDVVDLGVAGGVALVTQSGNVGVTALASRRGLRWHTVVSVGNSAVVDAAHVLGQLARAEGVRSIALYLEDDGAGARLAEALAECIDQDVRVAVLKAGRSAAGVIAGRAHTAAVAGDHRIFQGLVQEAGGAWCHDPHELLETAKLMATPRPHRTGALAVVTCSGGDSVVTADEADRLGVALATLAPGTRDRLTRLLPAGVVVTNPLDHTNALWADTAAVASVVEALAADQAVNQVMYVQDTPVGLPEGESREWKQSRDGLAQAVTGGVTKVVASGLPDLMPAHVADDLAAQGVTALGGIPTALRAVAAHAATSASAEHMRDVGQAATQRSVRARREEYLAEHDAKALLNSFGVRVPEGAVATSPEEAVAVAAKIGGSVAVKVSHANIKHKTDIGGVVLGLTEPREIADAADRLLGLTDDGVVLVESMVSPGVEVLVSATRDGVVPSLVVGLGGVWTEVLDDVAVIPLPADPDRIRRSVEQLAGYAVLAGVRGGEPLAIDSLCVLAQGVGELLLDQGLSLIELNPVIISASAAVAVDAVVQQ